MAMDDLSPFIGTWEVEAVFPTGREAPPPDGEVSTTFEWALDGQFLLQRSVAPAPIPNGICLIGAAAGGGWTQHYFDSRGVVRLYAMAFDGTTWTLERTTADFTPLDFAQRYTGTFTEDGHAIQGRWEIRHDGETWQTDFDLHYRRRS